MRGVSYRFAIGVCAAACVWTGAASASGELNSDPAAQIYWRLIQDNNRHFQSHLIQPTPSGQQPYQAQPAYQPRPAYQAQPTYRTQPAYQTPNAYTPATSTYTQPAPQAAAPVRRSAPQPAAARPAEPVEMAEAERGAPLYGFISELRAGVLSHDIVFPTRHDLQAPNPFDNDHEDGIDLNAEVVFVSPDFLKYIWSPRPHIGLWGNLSGNTHAAYAGFGWDHEWQNNIFIEGFLGMSVHTGKLDNGNPDRIEFGSRALFRLGGELGWRWDENNGLSVIWEHMSNAGLLDSKNQGIDNMGIRYSYRFSD